MALSIFDKLQEIGFGSIHAALDAVRNSETMSLPIAKQNLRALLDKRKTVDSGVANAIAQQRILKKDKAVKIARVAHLTSVITNIITDKDPTNDKAAKPKLAEQLRLKAEVEKIDEQMQSAINTHVVLEQALALVDSRIEALNARIKELESTQQQTAAKSEAAEALRSVSEILGDNAASDLDSTLKNAEMRRVQADVALEREMDALRAVTSAADADLELDAALADFKRGLEKDKPTESPAA